jgi:hypothetical protein
MTSAIDPVDIGARKLAEAATPQKTLASGRASTSADRFNAEERVIEA